MMSIAPEHLDAKIEEMTGLFAVERADVITAVLRQPTLLNFHPETLEGNVRAVIRHFDLPADRYIKAAIRQPVLFYSMPETLFARLRQLSAMIDVPADDLARAGLTNSGLLLGRPERIATHIRDAARLLDVRQEAYVALALRASKLFTLGASHFQEKMPLLQAIRRELRQADDAWSTLQAHPLAVTYSAARLRARLALARRLSGRLGYNALLSIGEAKAQRIVASLNS